MNWSVHIRRILARLGEDATFTHAGGSPASVRGLFTQPYAQVDLAGSVIVAGSNPVFVTMSADVPLVASGDTLVRGAVTFNVVGVEPDVVGGFVVLQLEVA